MSLLKFNPYYFNVNYDYLSYPILFESVLIDVIKLAIVLIFAFTIELVRFNDLNS